jgi:hypothetical protein
VWQKAGAMNNPESVEQGLENPISARSIRLDIGTCSTAARQSVGAASQGGGANKSVAKPLWLI